MSFRRLTTSLVSATALLFLLSVVGPSVQHVCAQLGVDVVCPVTGHEAEEVDGDAVPPCHEEPDEDPEGPMMACCDGSLSQLLAPDALLTDRLTDTLQLALNGIVQSLQTVDVPVSARTTPALQDRAPPVSDAPLFLLHASFLN